ncbi:Alpha-parvin [Echinococcus granulosus]|uniref:Alpha-parvin n=1 Tax=Echinococcus granulosus TaxID=6210 RepID=W6ULP4_ECHGR|nr:Alpha-parvin [Echinococcus granulosus]EUB59067.1 Alpha-parvin [Echinococcus granulosus]
MHHASPYMHGGSDTRGGGESGVGSEGSGGGHAMSLVDKLNTMSRVRRRRQEAEALASEARQAMEDPLMPITPEIGPVGYQLAEGDECSMLEPHSKEQPLVKELIQTLIEWINKKLIDERILVRDIEADLYDGQVLQKLLEKLTGSSLNQPELTQTEMGQRQRLKLMWCSRFQFVLEEINNVLGVPDSYAAKNWPIAAIFSKDLVAILRLLVALVRRFAPDVRLPPSCQLTLVIVRKLNGILQHRRQVEVITEAADTTDASMERDAISALVDCAVPEKLGAFQRILLQFVNQHLGKLNIVVTDLQRQMDDGVYFLLLMGLLGGYFIPLHKFHLAPRTNEQKLANLHLVLQLMQEAEGIEPGAGTRADDLLRRDLKATLRFLYTLYSRYKDVE